MWDLRSLPQCGTEFSFPFLLLDCKGDKKKKMRTLVELVVVALLCASCSAYIIKPVSLHSLGSAPVGEYFWQPSHPIPLEDGSVVVRVSRSEDACTECKASAVVFRDDGTTASFQLDHYCGSGGLISESTVSCFVGESAQQSEGQFTVKRVAFELSSQQIVEVEREPALFSVGDMDVARIQLANNVMYFPEKAVYTVNGKVTLANETVVHVLFRSTDSTQWSVTSIIPFPFGRFSTTHRLGETKVMLMSGEPGNFSQATSVFLGSRWEKVENVSYAAPLSAWWSKYNTAIYGGIRGRPGVTAMATSSKKGSEKPIDVTDLHNKLAAKQEGAFTNFSATYKTATAFNCLTAPLSIDDEDGCASSSFVAVTSAVNGTVVLFYDKLDNGFNAADVQRTSTVFAIKLSLNETKEENDYLAKVEEKKREAEREKAREEARKKAQQEAEERKKRERREKNRRDKAKKAEFALRDKVNMEAAVNNMALDGEMIVVRDVDPDYVDVEKDTFFF